VVGENGEAAISGQNFAITKGEQVRDVASVKAVAD